VIDSFIAAFNARDLGALKAPLAADATAQVIGSPFPVEHGPDVIAATSLPHMPGGSGEELVAEAFDEAGQQWVLLIASDGTLDTAATAAVSEDGITRIEYFVTHFALDTVRRVANARGISVRAANP
jgi:hypothetical protein